MEQIRGSGLKYKILNIWYRFKFVLTGDCGHVCGIAMFRALDGAPIQQFVPEADCPVHDRSRDVNTQV